MADDPKTTQDSPPQATSEEKQDTSQLDTLKAQVEELAQKKASDILAQKGREKDKVYESQISDLKKQQTTLQDKLDELDTGKGEDDSVQKRIEDRKRMRQIEADTVELRRQLEDTKAERDAERTKRAEIEAESDIVDIAVRYGIAIEDLRAELKECGITDPTKFERIAKIMAKKAEEPGRPDSGIGKGVSMKPTQIRKLYTEGQISSKEYEDKMKALGQQP